MLLSTSTSATTRQPEATSASLLLSCAAFGVTSVVFTWWRASLSSSTRPHPTSTTRQESTKDNKSPAADGLTSTSCRTRSTSSSSTTSSNSSSQEQEPKTSQQPQSKRSRLVRYLSSQHSGDTPGWWSDYSDDDEFFVQDLPKIELHVHLDGTFDPQFLWRYMQEHPDSIYCLPVSTTPPWQPEQPPLPIRSQVQNCQTDTDFHRLCTCRGYRSLKAMLNCFEVFLPLVRQNLPLLEQLAHDFCQRQHEQNVVYTEVRYSPHLLAESVSMPKTSGVADYDGDSATQMHNSNSITAEDVIHAVTRGLRRGCQEFPELTVHQVLCGIAWRPDWALEVVDLAKQFRHGTCPVVGIDVAAGEEMFDAVQYPHLYQPHYDMAQRAWRDQIPLTLHAGEVTTATAVEHIRRAIVDYHAVRIGHGYRMAECPATMELVRQQQVHVEVCPTSSVETGGWVFQDGDSSDDGDNDIDSPNSTKRKNWKEHPAAVMRRHGVSISLSSDDPAVFHTSLAWQYRVALAKMEFQHKDLIQMNLDAIDATWCSSPTKERLRKLILDYAQRQCVEGFFAEKAEEEEDTITSPSDTCSEEVKSLRWQRSKTDSFSDRVYVFEDERW